MPRKPATNARKQPQQERSKVTVEAILEATTRILIEDGYDKANTNRIAERAGISIGSLYQYFPNKESLIVALGEKHSQDMATVVAAHLDTALDKPLEVVLPQLIKAVIAAHEIDPRLHQILSQEIPRSGRSATMQEIDNNITNMVRLYLENWQHVIRSPDLDLTTFILCQTVDSLSHAATIERPDFADNELFQQEVCQLLISFLLRT
jgi:AcrR family transcriptional regulator